MNIFDLINKKLTDPIANMVAAALDSGIEEKQIEAAVEIGLRRGVYEHEHPEERSQGDKEPRYSDQVLDAKK